MGLIKDEAAWAVIEGAIVALIQGAEPGQWKKAINGWGGLPNSHQEALSRCEHAGLIDLTLSGEELNERVQYKLTAGGEGRRHSPIAILAAINADAAAYRDDKAQIDAVESAKVAAAPLTDTQREVLDYITANQPVIGKTICKALGLSSESTLTKHIIPALRPHGVKTKRGAGYYIG